jgi:hypothetical protein
MEPFLGFLMYQLVCLTTRLLRLSCAADAPIILCANKADGESRMRLRDVRALAAEFAVPLIETSQLNPRSKRCVACSVRLAHITEGSKALLVTSHGLMLRSWQSSIKSLCVARLSLPR